MDAMEAIRTRRSVRRYTDEPVTDGEILAVLKAGMQAPSARNQQPWAFVVVRDRKILDEITQVHPYAKMLAQAQAAIAVCGDTARQQAEGYWVQDCSACTQNILLAAHALGLGAVWLGVHPREERVVEIRRLLELPDTVFPLGLISVGRPAEVPEHQDRFDISRVHVDRWGRPFTAR